MKVIGEKVLVIVDKPTTNTQNIGGFVYTAGAGVDYEVAHVISVGEKVDSVKSGDTIYIYKGSGKMFNHEEKEYRTITLNEIIVVI